MARILILGGGFGGLVVARRLASFKAGFDVTLVDQKDTFDFLPNLPDAIGRGINTEFLSSSIPQIAKKYGFNFVKEEISRVDLKEKKAFGEPVAFGYDYLVISTGSQTNFYGNEELRQNAYKLDNIEDARRITDSLENGNFLNFIVSGGGYTGVEIASNLKRYLASRSRKGNIFIIERASSILGPLPLWIKNYIMKELGDLRIKTFTDTTVMQIRNNSVFLSNGEVFSDAMLIWAAGVKTSDFIDKLNLDKNKQGRIRVDRYLMAYDSCFVIGDAAEFLSKGSPLRMAVQFSIAQGECVARNILKKTSGKRLILFRPLDLGYIIPLANNSSCGMVMGFRLRGFLPTLLHFIMCIYRSYGLKNKIGIIMDLMKGGL